MENRDCPCKRTKCERHGKCSECREHHHKMTGRLSLTWCERRRKKEQEKTSKEKTENSNNMIK